MKSTPLFCVLVAFLTSQSALNANYEVVVTAPKPASEPHALSLNTKEIGTTPSYPWLSLSKLGLSAQPTAGALSFSDLRFRGFSSTQLSMTVDGIELSAPGTGLLDIQDLPFWSPSQVEIVSGVSDDALGAGLRLKLLVPGSAFSNSRVSFGSNGYAGFNLVASPSEQAGFRALAGVQIATSRGDYFFRPKASFAAENQLLRQNNDHQRLLGFFKVQQTFSTADLSLFFLARHHEGGLAGPASFPTPNSRLLSQKLLLASTLVGQLASMPLTLKWESHFDRNETHKTGETEKDNVAFISNSLSAKAERRFEFADTFSFLETQLGSTHLLDSDYRRLSFRSDLGVNTAPFSFWNMRFRRSVSLHIHSDVGWFLGFGTNISAQPIEPLVFGLRFGKNSRAPTLSEMFAPQGLILGNRDLEPEKVYDASLYLNFDHNSQLNLNLELFYAYLAKAILYVNKNAFTVEPINADKIHRGGLGLSVKYQLHPYFQVSSRLDAILSRVSATGASIPGTPAFAMTIDTLLGDESCIHGRLGSVLNSGSSSNLFGTLKTEPYALFNAGLHVPIQQHTRLNLSATNLTNVLWAKSTYNYPMPGFEFFVTLESIT